MKKKEIKLKLLLFELDGGGKHIAVKSCVNGINSILLIDTGASNTIFDRDNKAFNDTVFADVKGEGSGSGFNSEIPEICRGEIKSFKLGRLSVESREMIFTSMGHINKLYKSLKLPRITGILGSDILVEFEAVIDFGKGVLLLYRN
jgi:hypothetical protein